MTETADIPAIGVSFRHPLDEHRELVFQGFVPADCSDAVMNEFLDKLARAGERQKAIAVLPTHKGVLDAQREMLEKKTNELLLAQAEASVQGDTWRKQAQDSGRRSWKPTPAQSQEHIKIQATIAQCERDIRDLQKQIGSYEKLVSMYESRMEAGA